MIHIFVVLVFLDGSVMEAFNVHADCPNLLVVAVSLHISDSLVSCNVTYALLPDVRIGFGNNIVSPIKKELATPGKVCFGVFEQLCWPL